MTEYRVFGPPGTGKTTYAAAQIARAVEKHGPEGVLVSSFTKAAAAEIASREIAVADGLSGTLHSLCYRALGRPPIADTLIDAFNAQHPSYKLTEASQDMDEGLSEGREGQTSGDALFAAYQLNRARQLPRSAWNASVLAFANVWETFKCENQAVDFNDMIERCIDERVHLPGNPRVAFIDEAQDLSSLQFALVRAWARKMETVVFLGDDDQAIFGFAGSDARNLIGRDGGDADAHHLRVLSESYRLPRRIHACAQRWIERCSLRQAKAFRPRDADGEVRKARATWRDPQRVVEEIERGNEMCMVLATCSYMLGPTLSELRSRGVPFHNPYRRTRGDWNPLRQSPGSIGNRIRCYLAGAETIQPAWTAHAMKMWLDLVKVEGVVKRGVKRFVETLAKDHPAALLTEQDYHNFFCNGNPFEYAPATLEWLEKNALESKKKALQYPMRIIRRFGVNALDIPKVVVGTIHSVKGGEADSVYMFPDMSAEACAMWDRKGADQDAVRRVAYVGLTRARERLTLCDAASGMAWSFDSLLR